MKFSLLICLVLTLGGSAHADDKTEKKIVPDLDNQPVFLTFGMVVVHPKGVEETPEGYEGAMRGTPPLAILRVDDKVVGEVYGNPLEGKAKDEADDMRGSAEDSPHIDLVKRDSGKRTDLAHEITTLRLKIPSKLGNPWIIHSLYFPKEKQSVTFKLVVGEKDFERVLPLFEAMLFSEEFLKKLPDAPKPEPSKEAERDSGGNR